MRAWIGCQPVSQDGQHGVVAAGSPSLVVATFPMAPGTRFDWHEHDDHQLVWAASGVLIVTTKAATWVLPRTRALFIPAGILHETASSGRATLRTLYIRPDRCPIDWTEPTPVAASQLIADLIGHLDTDALAPEPRARAEAVLVDLLQPVPLTTIELRHPSDERAREVADALEAEPADGRSLEDWGRLVGASERTLTRAFVRDTGIGFGRWRTLVRLQAALRLLATGTPVGAVARQVGYDGASAFVAAFRRETGLTPAAYFDHPPSEGAGT